MISIVNVNKSWGIGCEGDLLVYIPEDMKFFRSTTAESVVIMGRRTLESFPGAKPLKGRVNLVLTGDESHIGQESREAADIYLGELDSEEKHQSFKELCNQMLSAKSQPKENRPAAPTVLAVVKDPQEAAELCGAFAGDQVFVIGGASIYKQLLPYCDTALVTINDSPRKADTSYPRLDELKEWEHSIVGEMKEYDGIHYHFDTFKRISE